jgi:hypothetical protein
MAIEGMVVAAHAMSLRDGSDIQPEQAHTWRYAAFDAGEPMVRKALWNPVGVWPSVIGGLAFGVGDVCHRVRHLRDVVVLVVRDPDGRRVGGSLEALVSGGVRSSAP